MNTYPGFQGTIRRNVGVLIVALTALAAVIGGGAARYMAAAAHGRTYAIAQTPHRTTAIVFGAGVWPSGAPTPILFDRVATAAELFALGKVDGIVMSGGVGPGGYDEPGTMAHLAAQLGVPAGAIRLDTSGTSTWATCAGWVAAHPADTALLVTQAYHMPRALFACRRFDADVVGVAADRRRYPPVHAAWWRLREGPASIKLLWQALGR